MNIEQFPDRTRQLGAGDEAIALLLGCSLEVREDDGHVGVRDASRALALDPQPLEKLAQVTIGEPRSLPN